MGGRFSSLAQGTAELFRPGKRIDRATRRGDPSAYPLVYLRFNPSNRSAAEADRLREVPFLDSRIDGAFAQAYDVEDLTEAEHAVWRVDGIHH